MEAVYTADTGSGGLANSSSPAYLLGGWWREDDPRDRTLNVPRVEVSIAGESIFMAAGKDHGKAIVRLHIYAKRDAGWDAIGSIDRRLWTLFHRVALTDSNNYWTFAPLARIRSTPAPATTDLLHQVVEFEATATRV